MSCIHKIRCKGAYAPRPPGATLKTYVAELDYTYPGDTLPVSAHKTIETPRRAFSNVEFYEGLHKIYREESTLRSGRREQLAKDPGRSRMCGKEIPGTFARIT